MTIPNLDVITAFLLLMLLLSLLVTTVVQSVVGCFNLRGIYLKAGVRRLLRQADHGMEKEVAREIARRALEHPAVAHSFGRATTAVTPAELAALLNDLASGRPARLHWCAGRRLRYCAGKASFFDNLERWFDPVMKRTTERYAGLTRSLTAVVATVACLALNLDSVAIYNQLAARGPLRLQPGTATPEHLPGILATVLFLNLGAPFWYNLLKHAFTLRRPLLREIETTGIASRLPAGSRPRGENNRD